MNNIIPNVIVCDRRESSMSAISFESSWSSLTIFTNSNEEKEPWEQHYKHDSGPDHPNRRSSIVTSFQTNQGKELAIQKPRQIGSRSKLLESIREPMKKLDQDIIIVDYNRANVRLTKMNNRINYTKSDTPKKPKRRASLDKSDISTTMRLNIARPPWLPRRQITGEASQ